MGAPLRREAGDVVTLFLVAEEFSLTIGLYLGEVGDLARENVVDRALAGDILYLTT